MASSRGTQKLGQTVIGTTIPPLVQGPDSTSPSVFKRPPVGSGCDYRTVVTPLEEERKWKTISTIDKHFQQKTLLMGLEGQAWGDVEKIERIRSAAMLDSLLPSSLSSEMIGTVNMKSGGLLKDWEF
jgi:hypothetical protein